MDPKNYTVALIRARIIDAHSFSVQRGNTWVLTKDIGGLTADTQFSSEQELYDRVAQGLVSTFQSGGLRVAS